MSTHDQMNSADAPEVVNNQGAHQWELRLDGQVIGLATYRESDGRIAFPHTEVNPEYEGRGYGSHLAKAALDDARDRGLRVLPQCPFIATYIRRHKEYAGLVDA